MVQKKFHEQSNRKMDQKFTGEETLYYSLVIKKERREGENEGRKRRKGLKQKSIYFLSSFLEKIAFEIGIGQ